MKLQEYIDTYWIGNGHTITDLQREVLKISGCFDKSTQNTILRVVNLEEFLNMELPKREMILSPFLTTQGLGMIFAKRGVGKTHIALGMAYAIATGGQFLKWKASKPYKVLYIDGEMPAPVIQERLRRIELTGDLRLPSPDYLRLITPDLQNITMPDLSTTEGKEAVHEFILESDVIILDNLSTLFRTGDENAAETWIPIQEWILELRRMGKAVIFVHHAGKTGSQRGTSKKEDILDVVIKLVQPDNHQLNGGAIFEVHFDKIRHFAGEEAQPFLVKLREAEDKLWYWDISNLEADRNMEKVVECCNRGLTIEQIVKETGLTKSQVETRKKKAKEAGLIK